METVVAILIPAIVENVFGALTEAVGLSDWLRQRMGRDPEKLAFHQALTQALTDSATHYPGRNLRYFAEILRDIGGPLLARTLQPAAPLPTADELTTVWLNHLTVDSFIHYRAEFTQFAIHFLDRLQFHLENQQSLRWIAQARHERNSEETLRRMANAAEQSAINLDILRQELASLTNTLATALQTNSGSTVATGGGAYVGGNVRAQHFAGRDLTINQYFVEGLARLVFNYSARIENFLYEYLGSKEKRVPFGGRQAQIDQLNTWLDTPDTPPYLLMVAEAGGGKSALVTRWCAQLATRTDLDVIFVPISIRFQTAAQDVAFAALAARLAQIYEQQSTLPAALSAEQWKGQCETYLRLPLPAGKRLLVVIDGLDEATGWEAGPELFAKRPPAGLRILVTARVRARETDADRWATRLGWQDEQIAHKFHLPGLDRRGIEEALVSMGNPLDHLATQVDLVGELHRLSQGDPLVVRLYVEALQAMGAAVARLRPEDLANIEPGLDGFMERWWEDQRKQWRMQGKDPFAEEERLLPLLHACTVACGPLLLNDLAELDKQHFGKGLLVTHMAELLGRWVIGDGRKQGYVFSHPRLRNYFSDRMTPDEEREWQSKFCGWGERVLAMLNAGSLKPKQAPEYLLRYYSTHLECNHAQADMFYTLISDGWRKAWEELNVSFGGFLHDINLAWNQAKQIDSASQSGYIDALVQQVRAAICSSSISALSNNMIPELLAQLIVLGIRTPTQALAMLKTNRNERYRGQMVEVLIPYLPREVYSETIEIILTIENKSWRASILRLFIPYLSEQERYQVLGEVLDAAYTTNALYYYINILSELTPYISEKERDKILFEALQCAREIENGYFRADALGRLTPYLDKADCTDILKEALTVVHTLSDPYLRARAIVTLAPHLSSHVLDLVLDIVSSIKDTKHRIDSLVAIAHLLPKENLQEIWYDIHRIDDAFDQVNAICKIAPLLSHNKRDKILREALDTTSYIKDSKAQLRTLMLLFPLIPVTTRKRVLVNILKSMGNLQNEAEFAVSLSQITPFIPIEFLSAILSVAKLLAEEDSRSRVLKALAPYLSLNLLNEAISIARDFEDGSLRASTLLAIAMHVSQNTKRELITEALLATNKIGDIPARVNLLLSIIPHISEKLKFEIHTLIHSISDRVTCAAMLHKLLSHLSEAKQNVVLDEIVTVAQEIHNNIERAKALTMIVSKLSKNQRERIINEILDAIRTSDEDLRRAVALIILTPQMSECQQDELIEEALDIIRVRELNNYQNLILGPVSFFLSEPQRTKIFKQLLLILGNEEEEYHVSSSLSVLALVSPTTIQEEMLHAAEMLRNQYHRATALGALIPRLSANLVERAWHTLMNIQDEASQAMGLATAATHLPANLIEEALSVAKTFQNESNRNRTLGLFAKYLPECDRETVLKKALSDIRTIEEDLLRAPALVKLIPHLSPDLMQDAVYILLSLNDERILVDSLCEIMPHLSMELRIDITYQAGKIGTDEYRTKLLRVLVPHLVTLTTQQPIQSYHILTNLLDQLAIYPRPVFF
jgi:hypothetical protein